jgi:hypothetical protein
MPLVGNSYGERRCNLRPSKVALILLSIWYSTIFAEYIREVAEIELKDHGSGTKSFRIDHQASGVDQILENLEPVGWH